jgi:3-oxoadipate enol-lactonase
MWKNQISAFSENYRVVAYDVRGHGKSEPGNDDFSIELFVKDLIFAMDTLQIDKAILCGLSMGGYIALNAIENYPERFNALVLCDTNCKADTPEGKEKRLKTIESIKLNGVEKFADGLIENLLAPQTLAAKNEIVTAIREMIVKTSRDSLFKTLIAFTRRSETCSKLQEIKVPVLIIVGKEDKVTPPEAARFMHDKIRGATLSIIEHAGHLSNLENPDQFNAQLKGFLASANKINH